MADSLGFADDPNAPYDATPASVMPAAPTPPQPGPSNGSLGLIQPDDDAAAVPPEKPVLPAGFAPDPDSANAAPQTPPDSAKADPFAAITASVPQFKDNPIGAMGFVLASMAAGFKGDPSGPLKTMLAAHAQQQELQMNQLNLGLQATDHGLKLAQRLPADQRDAFAEKYGATFEKAVPGFTDTLKTLVNTPSAQQMVDGMANLGPTGRAMLMQMSGGDPTQLMALAKDKDFMDRVQGADDRALLPSIAAKVQTINKMIGTSPSMVAATRNGDAPMTFANFSTINGQIAAKNPAMALTPQEMETLGRNEPMQTQLGIVAPTTSLKAAQSGAEANAQVPARAAEADATAQANAKYAAPNVTAFTSDDGQRTLAITPRSGKTVTVDLGGAKTKFDMSQFRADLALRASGKDVDNPKVQTLSPQEAGQVNDKLGNSDPLKSILGDLLSNAPGAAAPATATAPTPTGPGSSAANPLSPKTQAEFDAVKSGYYFVNPADGKVMRKK